MVGWGGEVMTRGRKRGGKRVRSYEIIPTAKYLRLNKKEGRLKVEKSGKKGNTVERLSGSVQ